MSKRSQPEDISTNEPVPKKQAITPEMYKKLEVKIAELEKRNVEAQEITQKQIEKFQDRTAKAEEKLSKIKEYHKKIINLEEQKLTHENYLRLLRADYEKKNRSQNRLDIKICNEIHQLNTRLIGLQDSIKLLLFPQEPQLPSSFGGNRGSGRYGRGSRGGRGTIIHRVASAQTTASTAAPVFVPPAATTTFAPAS